VQGKVRAVLSPHVSCELIVEILEHEKTATRIARNEESDEETVRKAGSYITTDLAIESLTSTSASL
jgi:hypothetical protein